MKMSATQNKQTENAKYFANRQEADEFLDDDKNVKKILSDPLVQPMIFEKRIAINLVLTVDATQEPEIWHLSMSEIKEVPSRVPDVDAEAVASAFFETYKEIPTKSTVYPNIRDFIAEKIR